MQTFLPHDDLKTSVQVLDYRRLGKQRLEALQIINALTGKSLGWRNHPATQMWAGHHRGLMAYHDLCIDEWILRGYKNTMVKFEIGSYDLPSWFGSRAFHSSHRAALLHKDFEFYRRYGWDEQPALDYIWPKPEAV